MLKTLTESDKILSATQIYTRNKSGFLLSVKMHALFRIQTYYC